MILPELESVVNASTLRGLANPRKRKLCISWIKRITRSLLHGAMAYHRTWISYSGSERYSQTCILL